MKPEDVQTALHLFADLVRLRWPRIPAGRCTVADLNAHAARAMAPSAHGLQGLVTRVEQRYAA